MLDRFFLAIANIIALLGSVLALVFVFSAVAAAIGGADPMGSLAFAATISIVTYCLAGTLHRIVGTPDASGA